MHGSVQPADIEAVPIPAAAEPTTSTEEVAPAPAEEVAPSPANEPPPAAAKGVMVGIGHRSVKHGLPNFGSAGEAHP